MTNKKIIATVLIASVLMPVTGCNKKDDIVKAVTEYADAVISGETDDIADLLEDNEDFDDVVKGYVLSYRTDLERNEIFDLILDNISYSIDSKSIKIDEEEEEASADITYTLLDYAVIYEDLEEGAGYDQYITALENSKDQTIEIKQTIELVMEDDKWIVTDEDFENTLEVYEFYEDITGFGWISATGSVGEFETALRNSIDFTSDLYTLSVYPDYTQAEYYYNWATFVCIQYNDPDAAADQFESMYEGYSEAIFYDDTWSGDSDGYSTGSEGEILFDATNQDYSFIVGDIYGGIYYNNDTIIFIYTECSNEPGERETVDAVIDEMGLNTPS